MPSRGKLNKKNQEREKTLAVVTLAFAFISALSLSLPVYTNDGMTKDDFLAACKDKVKEINCYEAKKSFDCADCIFLDCRTEKEFKKGSIPNALRSIEDCLNSRSTR